MDTRDFEEWASVDALNHFRDMIRTAGFFLTREPGEVADKVAGDDPLIGETIQELRRIADLCDRYRALCEAAVDWLQSETRGTLN